jgi:hypothetical protein
MSHDFAKGTASHRPMPSARRFKELESSSHWSWFLSGLLTGVFLLGLLNLALFHLHGSEVENIAPSTVLQSAEPGKIGINFQFYEELAKREVTVEESLPSKIIESNSATSGQQSVQLTLAESGQLAEQIEQRYLLQAGSFQERNDADKRRARILLLNLNATVTPGLVAGRTWFRVIVGPYDRAQADMVRNELSENNIPAILLRMR